MGWRLDAEEIQGSRRHVLDAGIRRFDFPVGKQHSGNQMRVHAMIAAPRLIVVGECADGYFTHRRIPTRTVPCRISHDHIRSRIQIGARV